MAQEYRDVVRSDKGKCGLAENWGFQLIFLMRPNEPYRSPINQTTSAVSADSVSLSNFCANKPRHRLYNISHHQQQRNTQLGGLSRKFRISVGAQAFSLSNSQKKS